MTNEQILTWLKKAVEAIVPKTRQTKVYQDGQFFLVRVFHDGQECGGLQIPETLAQQLEYESYQRIIRGKIKAIPLIVVTYD